MGTENLIDLNSNETAKNTQLKLLSENINRAYNSLTIPDKVSQKGFTNNVLGVNLNQPNINIQNTYFNYNFGMGLGVNGNLRINSDNGMNGNMNYGNFNGQITFTNFYLNNYNINGNYLNSYGLQNNEGICGMGIGDWGLGIGDWGLRGLGITPIPNPKCQSPIPNPHKNSSSSSSSY